MGDMRESHGRKVLKSSLRDDESGIALIYVTISLPVIIAFALLAVDVGRFMTLRSSLEHGADALALAGAAELDGTPDAITRAESAMTLFVTDNKALFTSSAAAIKLADVDRCYLASLPASDTTPIDPANCLSAAAADLATSSAKAQFVQVKVKPKSYSTVFPATFLGALTNNQDTTAEAVAGFTAVACDFTPMFMCNPYEPATAKEDDPANIKNPYGIYDYVKEPKDRRRQIAFKSQSAKWAPGNFGFLSVDGNGANSLSEQILMDTPKACFKLNKLSTQPGDVESVSDAFNVRFDLYPNGKIAGLDPKSYDPAPIVRKGYVPDTKGGVDYCKQTADPLQPTGMGLDKCFTSGSTSNCFTTTSPSGTPTANPRIGNGDWDFNTYWNNNYLDTKPVFSSDPPSRYDVYQYEVDKDMSGKSVVGSAYAEFGGPQCRKNVSAKKGDRRILYGAIINCLAANINGNEKNLQAVAFGKFFLTNPIDKVKTTTTDPVTGKKTTTISATLYTELVSIVRPGDGTGVARDMVQLYR